MQQRSGTSPPAVAEPSRRRPPRQRLTDPVPIPEAPPRPRPVRPEDVLAAHQQAVEERLQDALLRIQEAAAGAARTAVETAMAEAAADPTPSGGLSRALLAHAEERFRALGTRLERIETAVLALAERDHEDRPGIPTAVDIDRLAGLVREVGRRQGEATARLARAHHAAIERLAQHQRDALEDVGLRTGRGVLAVAAELRRTLQADLDEIRTSIRSMNRSLAWASPADPAERPRDPG